ncbi:MAG: proton-conducting transporter membrane subunit [Candidatus Cloacimonadota bacterium]|nr:proton-conducting transporter membrane subunit [Candidatus Cloacimonadota bacterium]
MWNNYLFLVVIIPLIVALVNLVVPKLIKKVLTFAGVLLTLIFSIKAFVAGSLSFSILNTQVLHTDSLSNFILLFVNILSLIILIYSLKNVDKKFESKYFLLFPLVVSFANGAVISANIIAFICFWGLSGLMLYLFGLLKGEVSTESSNKSFIIIGGSDVLLIIGIAIIAIKQLMLNGSGIMGISFANIFSLNLFDIHLTLSSGLSYVAFFCILLAAFAKAGAFPMHTWVPDYAKDAPIESVALIPAAMDKLLGIYLLARIMMGLFTIPFFIRGIVMILGAFTLITAVMMALVQHNGRKLLGYHAVSQVGYMVLGISTGNPIGIIGGLFHMVNNAIYKSSLFLSFGSVEKQTGTADLDDMGGLARKMPWTFLAALIGALSISGIPPLNGFFSKWMVYQGILETASRHGTIWQIIINTCLVLAVFGSALTLASFIKFIHAIFLSKLPKKYDDVKEVPFVNWFANNLLTLLCVIFGVLAFAVPVKIFILPILPAGTLLEDILLGFYSTKVIMFLFAISIILGAVIYLIFKKVRFDEVYVGTKPTTEANRVTGVDFYNEIKEMSPFRQIYKMAEKKYFDIYKWFEDFSFGFGEIFHKLHTGLLHTYAMWMLAGLVIVTLILVNAL